MPIRTFDGKTPDIGRGVFLAETCSVIGDVVIGESSSVWFQVVMRGDVFPIRIGARTNIQDNSVVHVTGGKSSTTIGDDVTVGHSAIVHGCNVGNRCLVGMGSIILDGAVIEDDDENRPCPTVDDRGTLFRSVNRLQKHRSDGNEASLFRVAILCRRQRAVRY